MLFRVLDNWNDEIADPNKLTREEWANNLVNDSDGFAINEDGNLILTDSCGNFVYCDKYRFTVQWSRIGPEKAWFTP